jgi:septum formation protein
MKLILASGSPRRAELLRTAGMGFETLVSEIEESRLPRETASAMVLRLAEAKARAASALLHEVTESALVIGADTVVELNGEVLGKPGSAQKARRMLGQLSGKTHSVLTGVAVVRVPDGARRSKVESTSVRFASLSDREIDQYVATGEPLDKAGGYAIQSLAGPFVERIEGCYFNVVGLPLARLYRMLVELGWRPDAPLPRDRQSVVEKHERGTP